VNHHCTAVRVAQVRDGEAVRCRGQRCPSIGPDQQARQVAGMRAMRCTRRVEVATCRRERRRVATSGRVDVEPVEAGRQAARAGDEIDGAVAALVHPDAADVVAAGVDQLGGRDARAASVLAVIGSVVVVSVVVVSVVVVSVTVISVIVMPIIVVALAVRRICGHGTRRALRDDVGDVEDRVRGSLVDGLGRAAGLDDRLVRSSLLALAPVEERHRPGLDRDEGESGMVVPVHEVAGREPRLLHGHVDRSPRLELDAIVLDVRALLERACREERRRDDGAHERRPCGERR
jgi:hypothetical protein